MQPERLDHNLDTIVTDASVVPTWGFVVVLRCRALGCLLMETCQLSFCSWHRQGVKVKESSMEHDG